MTVLAKNLEDLSVPLHPVESTTPDDEPISGLGAKRRHLRLVQLDRPGLRRGLLRRPLG